MAPLPQNNTTRLFLDYVTGTAATSRQHTFQVRWDPLQADISDVQARVVAVLNGMGAANFRAGWRVTAARVQSQGSNFSVPAALSVALAAFVGTNAGGYAPRQEAVEDTFQGRSFTSGRRVDLSLYRANGDAADNFRVPGGGAGLGTAVQNVATLLNDAAGAGVFLAIDGTAPSYYNYMNQNYNSYWEARSRST